MSTEKITELEQQIYTLTSELQQLQKAQSGEAVPNYEFDTVDGKVTLLELFGQHDKLLMIHNMGQGCRYCTLWGDGINGFVPHLESVMSVAMVSKDAPELQRTFANSRQWRMRMASHGGGKYMAEQVATDNGSNYPGAATYERRGNSIVKLNSTSFGPGDQYCSMWNFLGLAGIGLEEFTPQYNYWLRPKSMDDGGENLIDG